MLSPAGSADLGTVLLTGGTGQIGNAVRDVLRAKASRVIVLSGEERPNDHSPKETWIHWPYTDSSSPPAVGTPVDSVIHLGAQTSAHVARNDPSGDVASSVLRFVSLLQCLSSDGQQPFVVLAGSATQAGSSALALDADTPESPETFYDLSKTVSSMYLEQFIREGLVSGVTLRLSNVYGGSPRLLADRGLIAGAMRRALLGESLTLYRGMDGLRDFLHVGDAARACVSAILERKRLGKERYWIGSGQSLRISQALSTVIATAAKISGRRSIIHLVDPPPRLYSIEARSVTVDSSAFQEEAQWRPKVSFEEGVQALGRKMFDEMTAPN